MITVSKGNEVLDEISTNVSTGAILVFMSGLEEIKRVIQMVQADRQLSKLCVPVPMHSSLRYRTIACTTVYTSTSIPWIPYYCLYYCMYWCVDTMFR